MRKRFSVSVLTVVVAAAAGCGGGGEEAGDPTLTVYVSLSQLGPDGRDAADGARMALAEAGGEAAGVPVEARFFDDMPGGGDGLGWTPAEAAANARTATQDSTAIAYLGEFESGATRASLPITNSARLLQVSPASAAEDLVAVPGTNDVPETQPTGERSFGRVIPSDTAQGAAAGAWARELGWDQVAGRGRRHTVRRGPRRRVRERAARLTRRPSLSRRLPREFPPSGRRRRRRRRAEPDPQRRVPGCSGPGHRCSTRAT